MPTPSSEMGCSVCPDGVPPAALPDAAGRCAGSDRIASMMAKEYAHAVDLPVLGAREQQRRHAPFLRPCRYVVHVVDEDQPRLLRSADVVQDVRHLRLRPKGARRQVAFPERPAQQFRRPPAITRWVRCVEPHIFSEQCDRVRTLNFPSPRFRDTFSHAQGTPHRRSPDRMDRTFSGRTYPALTAEGGKSWNDPDELPRMVPPLRLAVQFPFPPVAHSLDPRGEEAFFSATAGLGAISLSAMGLGLMGLAGPGAFSIAAAATGVLGLVLWSSVSSGPKSSGISAPYAYALCLASLLLLPLILLPPFFYDTLHYHYGLPSIFLRSGHSVPLPYVVESYFPLAVEMLFMVGMSDGGYVGANLVNIFLLALCGLGILCLADRLWERRAGLAALPLFLFSSTAMYTVFMQKIELGVTLFFLAFTYSLLLYLTGGGDRRFLVLSGIFAGLALGTKYTPCSRFVPVTRLPHLPRESGRRGQRRTEDTARRADPCPSGTSSFSSRRVLRCMPYGPSATSLPWESGCYSRPRGDFPFPGLVAGAVGPSFRRCPLYRVDAALMARRLGPPRIDHMSPEGFDTRFRFGAGRFGDGAFAFFFRRRPAPAWTFLRNVVAAYLVVWFSHRGFPASCSRPFPDGASHGKGFRRSRTGEPGRRREA